MKLSLFSTMLATIFLLSSPNTAKAHFESEMWAQTFFSDIDKSLPAYNGAPPAGRRLVVDRFLRSMSRLSIYALYCDYGNKKGWSTLVSKQRNQMTKLDDEAAKIFGSEEAAYNRFEGYRNQDSALFTSVPDREKTCRDAQTIFLTNVKLTPAQMETYLSKPAYGEL